MSTQKPQAVSKENPQPAPTAPNANLRPSLFGDAKPKAQASTTDSSSKLHYRAPPKLETLSCSVTDKWTENTVEEKEPNPLDDGRYNLAIKKLCRNRKEWDLFVPYAPYLTRTAALGLLWTNIKEERQFNLEIAEADRVYAEKKLLAEKEAALRLAQEAKGDRVGEMEE
jgi:hypothetical protein